MTTIETNVETRNLWSAGDYAAIGVRIASMAEDLCEAADVRGGSRVIDIATGNGNVALCAARRDADVVGVDIVAGLLERARARSEAEGLEIDFREGDVERLAIGDDLFDCVLSCVGVQFAADQQRAAAELRRICRPGGRIALANWASTEYWTELPAIIARYAPPTAAASPMEWGTTGGLRSLFGEAAAIQVESRTFRYRFATVERFVDLMMQAFPPFARLGALLESPLRAEFAAELRALASRWNEATDGTLVLPLPYVIALIDVPAR